MEHSFYTDKQGKGTTRVAMTEDFLLAAVLVYFCSEKQWETLKNAGYITARGGARNNVRYGSSRNSGKQYS